MRRRGVVLVAAIVSALAACSSGGDADPAPTTGPSTTVAVSEPEATTTAVPATTGAPTTTLDPATTLAAEVEADLLEALALSRTAQMDPFDAAAEEAALSLRVGFAQTNMRDLLADWRNNQYAIRANPTIGAEVQVIDPARLVSGGGDVVEVRACEIDSWIVTEVGAGPSGTDAVVDSEIITYETLYFLRLVDSRWRIEGADEVARWDGPTSCDESS